MPASTVKPYLITKTEQGRVSLTLCTTRYNSQGFAWVTRTLLEETFKTPSAARAYAAEQFGAKPGEFATK